MKYQVRKAEAVTIYQATKVIELDDKKFRKLDENPYTGKTQDEFMEYLASLNFSDPPYDLDEETQDLMREMVEHGFKEYGNSAEKGSEVWLQIGVKDEEYRKSGGFKVENQIESSLDY